MVREFGSTADIYLAFGSFAKCLDYSYKLARCWWPLIPNSNANIDKYRIGIKKQTFAVDLNYKYIYSIIRFSWNQEVPFWAPVALPCSGETRLGPWTAGGTVARIQVCLTVHPDRCDPAMRRVLPSRQSLGDMLYICCAPALKEF